MRALTDVNRCPWCLGSELYRHYHDTEWGMPCRDDRLLFEMINLEGAQAGLSWSTILHKRERYREVFAGFDPEALVRFKPRDVQRLLKDPGIVRHRGKIEAVLGNARACLELAEGGQSFSDFIWQHVDHRPVQNRFKALDEVPASTEASERLSRALKKQGFKFVGGTIAYAFMQACGLVNDHLSSCPRHAVCKAAR